MAPPSRGSGDDGYTDLLGSERVPKYHPRPEAYGTVDEASAALGLAKALCQSLECAGLVETAQRDLYLIMTELAALPESAQQFDSLGEARVRWLEEQIGRLEGEITVPKAFVLPGDSPAGAAFELARTIVRRSERLVAKLLHQSLVTNQEVLRYLNRLSTLCFLLALRENQAAGVDRPALAKGHEE